MSDYSNLEIIHIDELVNRCGFFTSETYVNGGYGCTHPKQEEKDHCQLNNCDHGKCYSFSCPIFNPADLEDMKNIDPELYEEWKGGECPIFMGADLMVVEKLK